MSKYTENTKLWKLFEQRDNRERILSYNKLIDFFSNPHSCLFMITRNDQIDSEIDKLLRD